MEGQAEVSESPLASVSVSKRKDWLSNFGEKNKQHSERSASVVKSEGEVSETPVLPVSKMTGWLASLEQKNKENSEKNDVKLSLQKRLENKGTLATAKATATVRTINTENEDPNVNVSQADVSISNSPMAPVSQIKDWLTTFEQKNKEHYKKSQIKGANRRGTSTDVKTPARKAQRQLEKVLSSRALQPINVNTSIDQQSKADDNNTSARINVNVNVDTSIDQHPDPTENETLNTPSAPVVSSNDSNTNSSHIITLSKRAEVTVSPVRPVSERKDWLVDFEKKNKEHFEKHQVKKATQAAKNVTPGTYIQFASKSADYSAALAQLRSLNFDTDTTNERTSTRSTINQEQPDTNGDFKCDNQNPFHRLLSDNYEHGSFLEEAQNEGEADSVKNLASRASDFSMDQFRILVDNNTNIVHQNSMDDADLNYSISRTSAESSIDPFRYVMDITSSTIKAEQVQEETDRNTSPLEGIKHVHDNVMDDNDTKYTNTTFENCENEKEEDDTDILSHKTEPEEDIADFATKNAAKGDSTIESKSPVYKSPNNSDKIVHDTSRKSQHDENGIIKDLNPKEKPGARSSLGSISFSSIEEEDSERENCTAKDSLLTPSPQHSKNTKQVSFVNEKKKDKWTDVDEESIQNPDGLQEIKVVEDQCRGEVVSELGIESVVSPMLRKEKAAKRRSSKKLKIRLRKKKANNNRKEKPKKANQKKSIINKFSGKIKKHEKAASDGAVLKVTNIDKVCLSPQCAARKPASGQAKLYKEPLLSKGTVSSETLSPIPEPNDNAKKSESPYFHNIPTMKGDKSISLGEMAKDTRSCSLAKQQNTQTTCTDVVLINQDIIAKGEETPEKNENDRFVDDHVMWLKYQFEAANRLPRGNDREPLRHSVNTIVSGNGGKKKYLSPLIRRAMGRIGELASPIQSSTPLLECPAKSTPPSLERSERSVLKTTPQTESPTSQSSKEVSDAMTSSCNEEENSDINLSQNKAMF